MARCEVCGTDYDKAFVIRTADGSEHTFDSFECAVHRLASQCEHCGCAIIGHGEEVDGHMFCCAHCARMRVFEQVGMEASAKIPVCDRPSAEAGVSRTRG